MDKLFTFVRQHTLLVLIGITFLVYIPSFFGEFVWDDEDFVYANQHVANFSVDKFFTENATMGRGKVSNYYRPLQLTTYALEHAIFGFNPFIFHFSNVLWHIAAGVMVYLVMRSIPKVPWALAFGSALIFLLHPIQTEAASYVSGRSDMMFVFFLFVSFFCNQRSETKFKLVSYAFFIYALLSKESALLAFAFFPILSFIQYGFTREFSRAIKRFIPHLIIGLVYLVIRFSALEFSSTQEAWGSGLYATSLLVRLSTFFRNYFFYWQVLLFPFNLHMERDESTVKIITSLISLWSLLFVSMQIVMIGLLVWLCKKNQQYGLIGLGGYLGMHAVMGFYSGLILLNGIFYEHYLYSALPFVVFFLGSFIAVAQVRIRTIALLFIGIWILGFGIYYHIHRQFDWQDPIHFYTQTLEYAPRSVRIINGLGMAYAQEKKYDQALATYKRGISVDPTTPNFYHNMGNLYYQQGDYKQAERYFLQALEVDPQFYFSAQLLVNLYTKVGNKNKAEAIIQRYQ